MGIHFPHYMGASSSLCFPSGKTSENDIYKYGYIRHFRFKTAEELCFKIIKGDAHYSGYSYNIKRMILINLFFKTNKIILEKIKIIEKCLNITLLNWRKKLKNLEYI